MHLALWNMMLVCLKNNVGKSVRNCTKNFVRNAYVVRYVDV